MLEAVIGVLIASLLVWLARSLGRLMRGLLLPLGLPRLRGAVLLERLRGLRLRRMRAVMRAEAARATALAREVARLRAELRLARAERDEARARLALAGRRGWPAARRQPRPDDDRFQRAKREFARAFHPDRLSRGAPDRALRAAIFRDYWEALRRIERGG